MGLKVTETYEVTDGGTPLGYVLRIRDGKAEYWRCSICDRTEYLCAHIAATACHILSVRLVDPPKG